MYYDAFDTEWEMLQILSPDLKATILWTIFCDDRNEYVHRIWLWAAGDVHCGWLATKQGVQTFWKRDISMEQVGSICWFSRLIVSWLCRCRTHLSAGAWMARPADVGSWLEEWRVGGLVGWSDGFQEAAQEILSKVKKRKLENPFNNLSQV